MPHLTLGNERFYYETEGKGPPLVLIAGYSCDLNLWSGVREELARDFQLVLFDHRGVGKTEAFKDSFTIETMAEDVVHLIDALKLERPAVLGHSMGGGIVQVLAHRFMDKIGKTIIAQAVIKLTPAARAALVGNLNLLQDGVPRKRLAELIIPWLFSDALIDNPEFCELFIRLQEENPNPATPEGLARQCDALMKFDSRSWYPQIKTAPLILAGDEDRLCPPKSAEELAAKIPNARLHVFRGVGHVSPVECPQAFCEAVRSFLKRG
ncbi:MAG: alpha/beta fold hydrolase [Verrucomicrobia bacterium]|nr:alpha/beta fold hydrolase [Verrucomicrobiota bacterium]